MVTKVMSIDFFLCPDEIIKCPADGACWMVVCLYSVGVRSLDLATN